MAGGQVFAVCLFLILTVHGSEVVARIKFSKPQYTVSEGPTICIDVVNELSDPSSSLTELIIVTANIDATLLGINRPGFLRHLFRILPNASATPICFSHRDDNVTCEPPIVGNIQLLSSPTVVVGSPSSTQVTINDDDAAGTSFDRESYTYSESGLKASDSFPIVTGCKIQSPINLLVNKTIHLRNNTSPSLNFLETTLTVNNNASQPVQLNFTDDDVAMEQREVIVLELSVIPSFPGDGSECSVVHIEPHKSTVIYIEDDDVATMSIIGSVMSVREDQGSGQVCVELSHIVATPIQFELRLQSGTAQRGVDFSDSRVIGHFESFSRNLEKCFNLRVFSDFLVEGEESFTVTLHLLTNLPPSLANRLIIDANQMTVTIVDTSSCTHVDLEGVQGKDGVFYIPQQTTICFTCSALQGSPPGLAANTFYWTLGDVRLSVNQTVSKGKVFPNGTLLIVDSSQTFNTDSATNLSCVNNSQVPQTQTASVYLGAAPFNVSLSYKNNVSAKSMTLSCSYRGSPQPQLRWLRNNVPLVQRENSSLTVHTSKSSFDSLLTVPLAPNKAQYTFSCLVTNQFGNSSKSIVVSVEGGLVTNTQSFHNSSPSSERATVFTNITLTLVMIIHLHLFKTLL